MITEKDLQEAIAECQGQRNPNASTCIKLAAFYIIQEHLYGKPTIEPVSYSYASGPDLIDYQSGTEFSQAIDGKQPSEVWPVIDELMDALQVLNPKLYRNFISKLSLTH